MDNQSLIQDIVSSVERHVRQMGAKEFNPENLHIALHTVFSFTTGDHTEDIRRVKEWISQLKAGERSREEVYHQIHEHYVDSYQQVLHASQFLLNTLFGSVLGELHIPEDFWFSPLGEAIATVRRGAPDVLMTAGEAAMLIGVSRQFIHEEMTKGKLPSQQVGKNHVLQLESIVAYEKRRKK